MTSFRGGRFGGGDNSLALGWTCQPVLLAVLGMAHSEELVWQLREYASWIAPINLYPGEDEL